MASFGVEAKMEQYSGDDDKGKLVSSCVTPQLADGNTQEDAPHPQQLMERESPDSPSPVKKWEIGPLLQSFKSKMASFTEIVMSPVRLFKPTDSLSSIDLPDQCEQIIESNVERSIQTEKGETTDDKCKNKFSKRPSSEGVQCNSSSKRYRVAQKLKFDSVSTNHHEPVLECIQKHDDGQFVPNEEEHQMDRPSCQPQAILQDKKCATSPCTIQSPVLRSRLIPSSDKLLSSTHAIHASCQANKQTDVTVVLQRLSSTSSIDAACGYKSQSNSVFADSPKTFLNKPDSSSTFSVFHLKDECIKTVGSEEPCLQAIRRSPRKLFKPASETAGSTSSALAPLVMEPKTLDDKIKESQSINIVQKRRSSEVWYPPESTSDADAERCRETSRTETKKHDLVQQKCALGEGKEEGLGPANNQNVKDKTITLEENQEDIICVQVRKKRKGNSRAQKPQDSNMPLSISNTANVERGNSEFCDSNEIKEMGQEKTVRIRMRKNTRCRVLVTSSHEGDATDTTSSENAIRNVLIDKNLHSSNINTMYDCNYENSRLSEPPGSQHFIQAHEAEKTEPRMTRQHVIKSGGDASVKKRNLRPPKHEFEDFSVTSVVDPAGPSRPSKRTQLQNERSCRKSQRSVIATEEKEVTSQSQRLCESEARELKKGRMSPPVQLNSTVPLQSKRKPRKPTKTVNRQKRKPVSITKSKSVIGDENVAEIPQKKMEAIPVVSLSGSGSNRLLRSYSCPEIPSLLFTDSHVPTSHMHENGPTSPTKKSSPVPLPTHLHSPSKRSRRHTICSVEIEREFAPLCLRKEVYPAARGGPSHPLCLSSPYSPSTSLTALASCFLSSPLAFLSKSSSRGRGHASDISAGSTYSDASSFTSSFVTASSPSLCSSPLTSTATSSSPFTGPSTVVTPSPEKPSASLSLCSASSLERDHGRLQMECDDEKERSSFDHQFLSPAILEEKALSDSEIKTDIKDGPRGKVSSIRICKKIPKPLNNLTPMGLPKVIRIKKKDFSLEEIYTNKNFSKPPDGRLETIFEVPLNRRDGSEVVVGQKKVKRFVEFPELGVARKPKKSLVGGIAGGGAQRKAGGNSGICRTRRGVGASSIVEDGLTLQELDSLLCSRLQELDTWMALQQVAC